MNFPCQSAITTLRYLNDITSQFAALLICRYLRLSSTSLTDPFHQISVATVLPEKGQKLYPKTKKSKGVVISVKSKLKASFIISSLHNIQRMVPVFFV